MKEAWCGSTLNPRIWILCKEYSVVLQMTKTLCTEHGVALPRTGHPKIL